MTPGRVGARAAAKEETRKALLDAALALFAEQGFEGPSLDAICARAGYTRGAFYVHFASREDLVAAAMMRVLDDVIEAVVSADAGEGDLEATIERYSGISAYLRSRGSDAFRAPIHQVLEACRRAPAVRASFVALLEKARGRLAGAARAGQAGGRVRGDVEPEDLASLLVLVALGLRIANEVELPLDIPRGGEALLRLIRT